MKKVFGVFVVAMFVGCPMVVRADPVAMNPQPTAMNPAHLNSGSNATDILPQYSAETTYETDLAGVASAAYVKGAYNQAIRAVNKVANIADSKLPANIDTSSTGAIVTSITKNGSGEMVVSKGEISVPIANSAPTVSGNDRAAIWIQ